MNDLSWVRLITEVFTVTVFVESCHKIKKITQFLKGEFHGSAHARILTGLCTLSGTGPGFPLFMNQS